MNFAPVLKAPIRRFWFCRADSGRHLPHFLKHSLIALGHIDDLNSFSTESPQADNQKLIHRFLSKHLDRPSAVTSHLHQTSRFIYEAERGDLVLSVSGQKVYLGRITSKPYFKKESIVINRDGSDPSQLNKMNAFLRRDVLWITSFNRYSLPHSLQRGITSHQTFFNLDEYEREIYSMLAPYVLKDDHLFTTFFIKKESDVRTYDYNKLTTLFLKAEFIAKNLEALGCEFDAITLESSFTKFCNEDNSSSSLIAEFTSPGWTGTKTLLVGTLSVSVFVICLSGSLFGGEIEFTHQDNHLKANLKGAFTDHAKEFVIERLSESSCRILESWLGVESKQLKEKLKLKTPGTPAQIKEVEKTN